MGRLVGKESGWPPLRCPEGRTLLVEGDDGDDGDGEAGGREGRRKQSLSTTAFLRGLS